MSSLPFPSSNPTEHPRQACSLNQRSRSPRHHSPPSSACSWWSPTLAAPISQSPRPCGAGLPLCVQWYAMDRVRFGVTLLASAAVVATIVYLWQSAGKHSPTSQPQSEVVQKHSAESPPEKEQVCGTDDGTSSILILVTESCPTAS